MVTAGEFSLIDSSGRTKFWGYRSISGIDRVDHDLSFPSGTEKLFLEHMTVVGLGLQAASGSDKDAFVAIVENFVGTTLRFGLIRGSYISKGREATSDDRLASDWNGCVPIPAGMGMNVNTAEWDSDATPSGQFHIFLRTSSVVRLSGV